MKKFLSLLLAATILAAPAASFAKMQPIVKTEPVKLDRFIYDPVHTQIGFRVSHLDFSFPHGRFTKFSGGFSFDPENVEASTIDATINTASLVMDDAAWEKHLKGEDFFNADKFPTMTFKSTKVEKTGDKTGKVTGDLTLLGVTKPVVLDVTWNKSGIFPMNKNFVAGFSATGKISRSDFNMNFGLPGVGDDVTIDLQVEGVRQDFEKDAKAEKPAAEEKPAKKN